MHSAGILSSRLGGLLSIATTFGLATSGFGQAADLFISEYVEGSSDNKALEIYNGTAAEVDLARYSLAIQRNGLGDFGSDLVLSGTLGVGESYVLADNDAAAAILAVTDREVPAAPLNFNGDDVLGLLKDGSLIDVLGEPGDVAWGEDVTLRRQATVEAPTTTFGPAEWEERPNGSFEGLGEHTFSGLPDPHPEPSAYPSGFSAVLTGSPGVGATLSWTDAGGEQAPAGYLILFSASGSFTPPSDGGPTTPDIDFSDGSGAFTVAQGAGRAELGGLPPGATIHFAIFPYTNGGSRIDYLTSGTAPTASVTTDVVELMESFAAQGSWTIVTAAGTADWQIASGRAVANAYNGGNPSGPAADTWLVSPEIDFGAAENLVLSFDARLTHDDTGFDPALTLFLLTDYDGSGTAAALAAARQVSLTPNLLASPGGDYVNAGMLPLADFSETGYIAFRYQSTSTGGSTSEQWEIDNVYVFASDMVTPSLQAGIAPSSVFANAGPDGASLTVEIPEAREPALLVSVRLSPGAASLLSAPASLEVPAGATSASAALGPVEGLTLDAAATITVTLEAAGYLPATTGLEISPTPARFLTLTIAPTTIDEGGTATGKVTLSSEPENYPLTVQFASSDSGEASVPTSVSIDSGDRAEFLVTGVLDGRHDLAASVTITATAPGFGEATAALAVNNVDPAPALVLAVEPGSIFESAGEAAAVLSITLPQTPLGGYPVTVELIHDDTDHSEISLPVSVTFTAGDGLTKTVAVGARADDVPDGDVKVTLTARASGYADGSTSLEVLDVGAATGEPTIALLISPATVDEGGSSTGTIVLSRTSETALVVNLTSTDPSEAHAPSTVTVPAGAATGSFEIMALLDHGIDGDQTVSIVASAAGWVTGQRDLAVRDVDVPKALNLQPRRSTLSEGESSLVDLGLSVPPAEAAEVQLDLGSDLTGPATVSVPAGATIVSFQVTAMAADGYELTETALFRATLAGYAAAEASVTVENTDPRIAFHASPADPRGSA